jgi:4-aminobutyrate aminotransferase/(S)-3-amino-2-methylpropionate transaminase
MDSAHVGGLGGTYGGNPVACAAALAAIDAFEHDGLVERAEAIGTILLDRLRTAQASDARIGDVRGRGAMVAIELVDPATGEPDPGLTGAVVRYAYEHGVIALTAGTYGNVVRFLPPLAIDDALLGEGLDVVLEGLAAA